MGLQDTGWQCVPDDVHYKLSKVFDTLNNETITCTVYSFIDLVHFITVRLNF